MSDEAEVVQSSPSSVVVVLVHLINLSYKRYPMAKASRFGYTHSAKCTNQLYIHSGGAIRMADKDAKPKNYTLVVNRKQENIWGVFCNVNIVWHFLVELRRHGP